jgi:hypothetical protein
MWTEVSESAADLDLGGTVRRISWRSSPTEIVSYGFPGSRKPLPVQDISPAIVRVR